MSLLAPQETSGVSYDIFDGGVDTTASGTVQIKLYIPKSVASGAGSFVNTYSINVTNVGEIKANFDAQDSIGDLDTFEFNVPSFKFGAHDPVTATSTNNADTLVTLISQAMMRMPVGYVATIELIVNGGTTYFYAQKSKTSFKVLERDIEFEGVHPMALAAQPFGKDAYENTTYSIGDLVTYRGYSKDLSIFVEDNRTPAAGLPGGLPGKDGIAFATITASKFMKDFISYLAEDSDTIIYKSIFFKEEDIELDLDDGFSQVGNTKVLMCGEFGAVEADQELNKQNIIDYPNPNDNDKFVTPLPSVFKSQYVSPVGGGFDISIFDHINIDTAIEYFIKMARCDVAIFGSILGEAFYMPRSNKDSQYDVSLSSDQILSVDIKQDPINPKTFDLDYLIMRGMSGESSFFTNLSHITSISGSETVNQQGTHEVDISFNPVATTNGPDYSNLTGTNNAKGQMIFKLASEDEGNNFGFGYVLAPFYYDTSTQGFESSSYESRLPRNAESGNFTTEQVIPSYKNAVKFSDGTTVKCTVVGIDTIKPYSVIGFDSGVHPELAGKDFRVSSISYKLDENTVEFEAYEF